MPAKDENERKAKRPLGSDSALYHRVVHEWTDIIKAADRMGVWGCSTIEHHLHSEGYEVGPNPGVLNAYWANHITKMRVGALGYVAALGAPFAATLLALSFGMPAAAKAALLLALLVVVYAIYDAIRSARAPLALSQRTPAYAIVIVGFAALATLALARGFFGEPYKIPSSSMAPLLQRGDLVLVSVRKASRVARARPRAAEEKPTAKICFVLKT